MKESELGARVMSLLESEGWDCYPEAQIERCAGRADIAAVQSGRLWIVECKTTASLSVLEQAHGWRNRAHWVSVAVPRINPFFETVAQRFGIGVLVPRIGDYYLSRGWVHVPAQLRRSSHASARRIIGKLHPDMKRYRPGSTAAEGYSTPWSRTMDAMARKVRDDPGITLKSLIKSGHHYASDSTARACLPEWLCRDARIEGRKVRGAWQFYPVGDSR